MDTEVFEVYKRIKFLQKHLRQKNREDLEHYTASLILFLEKHNMIPDYFEYLNELSMELHMTDQSGESDSTSA
ncbi:MAG: hypothetical protein HS115_00780 [Spirochaetales bacterium]|nr:hypothetical protein [Spirochaetales bacterium]